MACRSIDFGIVQVVQEFSRAGGAETVAFELQRCWEAEGEPASVLTAATGADAAFLNPHHLRYALPRSLASRIPTRGRGRYVGRAALIPGFTLAASAALRWAKRPGGWAEHSVILSHGDSLVADVIVLHAVNAASLARKRQNGEWRWALNPVHLWVKGRDALMLRGRRARRYVAVSHRVKEEAAQFHRLPLERIEVIPNGTDLDRFSPVGAKAGLRQQFGIPEAAPLLLFVGHEFQRKGLLLLIGALSHPGCETAHVVAVGDGDAIGARAAAKALGVGSRVHFTGPRNDLPALYRDADAFVLPSAYETFSLVCLDAMACGVPVFATRVGGVEDYLKDGHNGLTIERDSVAIAAAIGPMLADRAMLRRLGAGGCRTARDFAWEHIAKQYRDLLWMVWHEQRSDVVRASVQHSRLSL